MVPTRGLGKLANPESKVINTMTTMFLGFLIPPGGVYLLQRFNIVSWEPNAGAAVMAVGAIVILTALQAVRLYFWLKGREH